MLQKIKSIAQKYKDQVQVIRAHLHQYPELSFQEHNTSNYIKNILQERGIEFESIADTGIVATINGKSPQAIGLRAELDALPIQEENNTSYTSKNKGVMHACGHDVHMASLLGTTFILNELKEALPFTIKVLFQPGEEKLPGGASIVLKEGFIEKHQIKKMIAQHVAPSLPVGQVGFKSGMYMASCDELYLTVTGKGGHAALKETYNNPLLIASDFLLQAEQVINNCTDLPCPSVLSFGKINSVGGATNVIPDQVKLLGTFRTFDEGFRAQTHKKLAELSDQLAEKHKATLDLEIKKGYPFLKNDQDFTEQCKSAATEFLGSDQIIDLPLRMTSEDFAYFSQKVPVCFYRLGVRNELKNITSMVHTPTFDVDQDVFDHASGLMAYITLNLPL